MMKWLSYISDTDVFPVRVWISQQNCVIPSEPDKFDIRSWYVENVSSNLTDTTKIGPLAQLVRARHS